MRDKVFGNNALSDSVVSWEIPASNIQLCYHNSFCKLTITSKTTKVMECIKKQTVPTD